jgi:hypothetical protein
VDHKGPTLKVAIVKGYSLVQQAKFRVGFNNMSLDVDEDPEGEPKYEEDFESDMIMPKVDNQKHLGQVYAKDLQITKKWQEYIFRIEKEMPNLEVIVSSLQKEKDEAYKELEKVDSQIEARVEFVATREEELQQLQMQLQAL